MSKERYIEIYDASGDNYVEVGHHAVHDWKLDAVEDDGDIVRFEVQVPTLRGALLWTHTYLRIGEIPDEWLDDEVLDAIRVARLADDRCPACGERELVVHSTTKGGNGYAVMDVPGVRECFACNDYKEDLT